jgi:hypothetical protein
MNTTAIMFWNTYIPLELPEKESMSENEFFKFCAIMS